MIKLNKKDEKYSASTPPRTRLYKITYVNYPGFYPDPLCRVRESSGSRFSFFFSAGSNPANIAYFHQI